MKYIAAIISMIIDLVIILGAIWFGYCAINTYAQAKEFANMGTGTQIYNYVSDHDHYTKLQDSYNLIVSIPFIGETL